MTQEIALIRGDGIGPEICQSVIQIFNAAEIDVKWFELEAGLAAFEKTGEAISNDVIDKLADYKVALKGPTTTPVGKGHRSINVQIRKKLDLYVNVRPCRTIKGVDTRFKNVDLIVVRENIEDTYGGVEYKQTDDLSIGLRISTRSGALRAHRFAFEMAQKHGRKRVTCVHKANIMKLTDGQWLQAFRDVSKDYPEIEADDIIVDNLCMQLVTRPQNFDVLVLPNLFGDIVSDLCAGLVGGLGVASGANIGDKVAIFEAVHGSAPDIAGQGISNPTALLSSAITMLRHINLPHKADLVQKGMNYALGRQQVCTADLGGCGDTESFTKAVIEGLKE